MHQVVINDIIIDVVRKDIKNLHLAVYPPLGRVRIAAPKKMDNDAIRLFVISKLPWIKKHKIKFKEQVRQLPREYVSGESHYFQGKRYLLNVIYAEGINRVSLRNKTYIDLFLDKDSSLEQRHQLMTEWYRNQMKVQMLPIIRKWQKKIGLSADEYRIKQMKTKWGSCSINSKRIWLNLELIKKPQHCMEYIIVHELVHFLERRHNDRFIAYMDKFMPQWHIYRDELNCFALNHAHWKY